MAKFWPHYRHVPDLGFSLALHVYTIHREISSSPVIVENSWPNFGHFAVTAVRVELPLWTCTLHSLPASASLYMAVSLMATPPPL